MSASSCTSSSQKLRRNASPSTKQGPIRATRQFGLASPSRNQSRTSPSASPGPKDGTKIRHRPLSETCILLERRSPSSPCSNQKAGMFIVVFFSMKCPDFVPYLMHFTLHLTGYEALCAGLPPYFSISSYLPDFSPTIYPTFHPPPHAPHGYFSFSYLLFLRPVSPLAFFSHPLPFFPHLHLPSPLRHLSPFLPTTPLPPFPALFLPPSLSSFFLLSPRHPAM